MGNLNISTRYANALMRLASDKNLFEEISADVDLVYNTFRGSRELQVFLKSPVIKSENKVDVLAGLFKGKISPDTLAFLEFIVKKNREELIYLIVQQYIHLRDEKLGRTNAQVVSVLELNDEQKEKLKNRLEELTKKKVRLTFSTDSRLVGGFIVRIGDTVLDASLKRQLELLREQFLKENSSVQSEN